MPHKLSNYRGRYNDPVPTKNIGVDHDLPEFEPFDDVPAEAFPRSYPGDLLSVSAIDMCQAINKPYHNTGFYDNPLLVVRRGMEFQLRVSFNRPPLPSDDFQLEFLIGANPSPDKGTFVVVPFGQRSGSFWMGRIVDLQGSTLLLGITPATTAIVGKFRLYVAVVGPMGLSRTSRDPSTDLYLLFNAWSSDDAVYLADDSSRREYVLNDSGVIYQGDVSTVTTRSWMYGQFEKGVLDACIYILDASLMPIYDRGNALKLVRVGAAMINAQDDNGVLVGNWSDNYSMGTAPTLWTGSVKILLQYANTGVPVCFAQCWVYAGVFNTFLRCLGIPSRIITNFNSAHDNNGNLRTELIFKMDGSPDTSTKDSIWNFHCWNEVFTTRPDLPSGLGGWQVVDATPQETSDGNYRCGPCSVSAIKDGLISNPFDGRFVFAEVNSIIMYYTKDRYGTLTLFGVDKNTIGAKILTKTVGSDNPTNITQTYKYPKGSPGDLRTMQQADSYGLQGDQSDLPTQQLAVTMEADRQVSLGQDFNMVLQFHNQGTDSMDIEAAVNGTVVFYTGVTAKHFKDYTFSLTVQGGDTQQVLVPILADEYMAALGSQNSLQFVVTSLSDDQSVTVIRIVNVLPPALSITMSGTQRVGYEMVATVTFTNPLDVPLENVVLAMEAAGMMEHRTRKYSEIMGHAAISWSESFVPRLTGVRHITATLDSPTLREVQGSAKCTIAA